MKEPHQDEWSSLSMFELFRAETENQTGVITAGLLDLERESTPQHLEALMRAAHSLKGAARIVNLEAAVGIAHAMEDCFVAAQQARIHLRQREIDVLFQGVDLLLGIARKSEPEIADWERDNRDSLRNFLSELRGITFSKLPPEGVPLNSDAAAVSPKAGEGMPGAVLAQPLARVSQPVVAYESTSVALLPANGPERVMRLAADSLNRMLGLAGEALVESRRLHPFANSLLRLKRLQSDLARSVELLRDGVAISDPAAEVNEQVAEVMDRVEECRQFLAEQLVELENHDRRATNLSQRLYREVLQCRMRPFGDGARRFPRMVRDLARTLGKQVRLEIAGRQTQVDRDILEKLETPLAHLLRNAVDHGCESPEERRQAGKPAECVVRLDARHSAGTLLVSVSDDGAGVNLERLREAIVQKRLAAPVVAASLGETELLNFLLLPGFTLRDTVTEISGRGVGLDVVNNMVRGVRGSIHVTTHPGRGMRFQLQLPLTLSVVRTLLVEVAGEPYAIPLAQITRALKVPREKIESHEARHHFSFGDQQIGLVPANQVLGREAPVTAGESLAVVILGGGDARHGLVVDRLLGELELVIQPLDSRLGKIPCITAGALMEDGSPVLLLDAEDVLLAIGKLVAEGTLSPVQSATLAAATRRGKRILAVDDSLTVRELQRKLLATRGYSADVAVDGMDGWNAVRSGSYDLVITDVDMPRMDGIELTSRIKADPGLKMLPVMIVSYKDREEDRLRGLEAGADYYLAKGGFHDETLLRAVADLIGSADE